MKKTTDPNSPLYQAQVLGTGQLPNDSMIDDGAGPANIKPTVDYAQTDPVVDSVETPDSQPPAPLPPGSIATHVDIAEDDMNMLADRQYTMRGDD